jgi:hypothetical protein
MPWLRDRILARYGMQLTNHEKLQADRIRKADYEACETWTTWPSSRRYGFERKVGTLEKQLMRDQRKFRLIQYPSFIDTTDFTDFINADRYAREPNIHKIKNVPHPSLAFKWLVLCDNSGVWSYVWSVSPRMVGWEILPIWLEHARRSP